MQVGYVVNSYPLPSHSFIRREIAAVESLGVRVHRIAMRGDASVLREPADLAEHRLTEHLHDQGTVRLLGPLLVACGATSSAVVRALAVARRRAAAGEGGLARQIAYLAEGAVVARRSRQLRLAHLHAHFGTNSARIAAYARLLGGPPFSFTVHGPEEYDAPERLDLGGKVAAAAFTVAISSYGRSQLYRWAAPGDWDRIHVVHCGLESSEFAALPMLAGSETRLVAVGRFVEQKGFGLLIRAFSRANRIRPQLRLTLVGDGPLRPQVEAAIAELGLGEAIAMTGWQDSAGVRRAMAAGHALVVPSFAEGLPVVMMEAMALARPVVATAIAGIPELLRPGIDGWLIPAGDIGALETAMLAVADAGPQRLAAMGHQARARVLTRHDIAVSARRLVSLFQAARPL